MSTYQKLAEFAQSWGLIYFVVIFLCVVAYAFWPSKKQKEKFDEASRIPLKED
ncbi:MAG: cbb3-type cytochrome c oxidase subunit 3 [Pseudorhodoplanes sp.]